MPRKPGRCPLTTQRIVDEYFIENRHKLLDIAAFLDRLDRSQDGEDPTHDFRMKAFAQALQVLMTPGPDRLKRIHMVFSDPSTEPREKTDRKAAWGAYNPSLEVL
ncbi:MAG: hypothetical protein ABSC02_04050 [Acidobacteriota bacterium]|jgi:hypothetical protein